MPTIAPKDIKAAIQSAVASSVALAGAPAQAIKIYQKHKEERLDHGDTDASAHQHGLRMLQHAGWFKGPKGFQQVHPDLREKVNVREAFEQPDGTFCIYDVDCFYPNAVKGEDEVYTASDIRQIMANTNRGIGNGGQKPGLLEGHPNPMQAAIGTQLDAHGFGVNWRESPRGAGWSRCDLIGVDPEYVQRLREKKLTGLSAGIARDAAKLNRRIGHVALLGGSSQALSHLPTHDIFSSPHYVCFSADSTSFSPKGKHSMKLSDTTKKCFSDFAEKMSAYAAAEHSEAAMEPEATAKLEEAGSALKNAYSACKTAFDAEMGPLPAPQPGDAQETMPGAGPSYGVAHDETYLPTDAELKPGKEDEAQAAEFESIVNQFSAEDGDPAAAFSALTNIVKKSKTNESKLVGQVHKLTLANAALNGKLIREDFSAFCASLKSDGHQFEDDFANGLLFMALESKNPHVNLEKAKATLKKSPKVESLAGMGSVFSADNAAPAKRPSAQQSSQAETDAILRELSEATGRDFSADDLKLGSVFSNIAGFDRR